ncbi:hypothetical protein F5Y18DRAFT_380275 [Xylariaceae sp. FL1019]|nr:hypothetical protein F5Y18DRAFT_380275 [Xylariaceae sp. FL1019]
MLGIPFYMPSGSRPSMSRRSAAFLGRRLAGSLGYLTSSISYHFPSTTVSFLSYLFCIRIQNARSEVHPYLGSLLLNFALLVFFSSASDPLYLVGD